MNTGGCDRVVVIGGGVIGAMCAWNLVNAGLSVTIVDREKFGAACSHGNCGYVSPSHVFPLCQPGAITKTLKGMLKSNSAFAVKPRFETGFASWFWNFARRCNHRDMMCAGVGRHAILQSSKLLYQELISSENIDCEWQEVGLLFVYDDEKSFAKFGKTESLIRREFGVEGTPYDGQKLVEIEPADQAWFRWRLALQR